MLSLKLSQRRQRHGAPSGPWPFVDLDDEVDEGRLEDPLNHIPLSASPCEHNLDKQTAQFFCWCKYPQSLYPNWTPSQQQKSRILDVVQRTHNCVIRYLDVNSDGMFVASPSQEVNRYTLDDAWAAIQTERPEDVRLRMLFVDNCSGPVLQMIGTRYNVEPFYFSSTIGWTPCRFQSNVIENESDHLTIIFTFIRSTRPSDASTLNDSYGGSSRQSVLTSRPELAIDTQKPLLLGRTGVSLTLDRLALHMVRSREGGTIVSLHPPRKHHATTAKQLHTRVHLTGKSVYWCNIFKDTTDPTFVFLSYFWYAVYAWDEALENLYNHISSLESDALGTDQLYKTHELHSIRARLQFYTALLVDFTKSIKFVKETPNPSLGVATVVNDDDSEHSTEPERLKTLSQEIMDRECNILLSEINRLGRSRHLMELRLKNVMALTFGRIEIDDNKQRQRLTEASLNDNAVMKQLTYLTMFFLPAGFCANVWSMNVTAINPEGGTTLWEYFALSLPLTILSIYVIVAYQLDIKIPIPQRKFSGDGNPEGVDAEERVSYKELTLWNRVFWPVTLVSLLLDVLRSKKKGKSILSRPG